MSIQLPTITHVASKAAFIHVTDVILENSNVTAAFKEGGIEEIPSILKLTDVTVTNFTFPDSDPAVTMRYCLNFGEINLIKTFIHYVHYRQEINEPNQWLRITQEDFFIKYTRRFSTLSNLPPIAISPVNPTAPCATSPSSTSLHIFPSPVNMFSSDPTPPASMFTLAEAKAALKHLLENVIDNENVTSALYDEGIDNIIGFVKLTDEIVPNLTYHDPDSKTQIKLQISPIGRITSFIHYVHCREETNPIGNDWKSITMDDFYQFRFNLKYVCRFASLSSLPTLDMMYVNCEPNSLDVFNTLEVSDVFDEIDVLEGTDADDAPYSIDVSDVLDESDIFTVTDVLDITDIVETTSIDSVIDVTKVSDVKIVVVDIPNVLNVTNITDVVQ
jgi:hypothetical protein